MLIGIRVRFFFAGAVKSRVRRRCTTSKIRKRFDREHEASRSKCYLQYVHLVGIIEYLSTDLSIRKYYGSCLSFKFSFSLPGDVPRAHQEIEIIRYAALQKLAREIDGL
ncbi:hypothetical protein PUN28_002798 [Cardiocondyla obscurior]|uniref:Uncharacterized protein n=1 Tax=Cardiocondyla obscurior TaxID=286306 RepID=A0AAW2GW43_9HYME